MKGRLVDGDGVVGVVEQSGQIGRDMLVADEIACTVVFVQVPDGVAVFHYILSLTEVGQQELMSGRNIVVQGDELSVDRDLFTLSEGFDGYCYVVGRIDLDSLHIV